MFSIINMELKLIEILFFLPSLLDLYKFKKFAKMDKYAISTQLFLKMHQIPYLLIYILALILIIWQSLLQNQMNKETQTILSHLLTKLLSNFMILSTLPKEISSHFIFRVSRLILSILLLWKTQIMMQS